MIKFENTVVSGWEAAIRGCRNPKNSWDKSDSGHELLYTDQNGDDNYASDYTIGPNDMKMMKGLVRAGTDEAKFMRYIDVTVDIVAPLYWWKEFDTYKVGTVANSCSTMHKIHDKEFTLEDFSHEHLDTGFIDSPVHLDDAHIYTDTGDDYMDYTIYSKDLLIMIIELLNVHREMYLKTKNKEYWWQMIQLLPSSYNQRRTVKLNYQVLRAMYFARRNHKLDEWREGFCEWVESLPYSELITMNGKYEDLHAKYISLLAEVTELREKAEKYDEIVARRDASNSWDNPPGNMTVDESYYYYK